MQLSLLLYCLIADLTWMPKFWTATPSLHLTIYYNCHETIQLFLDRIQSSLLVFLATDYNSYVCAERQSESNSNSNHQLSQTRSTGLQQTIRDLETKLEILCFYLMSSEY